MPELLHKSKTQGVLTLVGAVVVVVALLVYFLPRESKFGYEYEQGRPWRYNSLIATFDFPIYKTQKEVETELIPVYQFQHQLLNLKRRYHLVYS